MFEGGQVCEVPVTGFVFPKKNVDCYLVYKLTSISLLLAHLGHAIIFFFVSIGNFSPADI